MQGTSGRWTKRRIQMVMDPVQRMISASTIAKKRMALSITMSRKLVPQRG